MRIFEYHRFNEEFDEYQYSRTYRQFENDLAISARDDIFRFDDGYASQLKAVGLAVARGRRVVVGITTGFIGKPGYMTWDDVRRLRRHAEIGNHSQSHGHLDELPTEAVIRELLLANNQIHYETGVLPEYYLPTYNFVGENVKEACNKLGLKILNPVIIIYNK